ncbi:MAG TPA: phosphopantetheine-binding protein [Streptosporangiaceae bacterium]|nr:phosphopantetheine-binding protein [Streptosporangiaceae bacterium]
MSGTASRDRVLESLRIVLPKVLASDTVIDMSEGMLLDGDLGLSSAATMALMLELEETLEIQIDVEEIEPTDLASVGALADYIAGHTV